MACTTESIRAAVSSTILESSRPRNSKPRQRRGLCPAEAGETGDVAIASFPELRFLVKRKVRFR